jgi:hypothetical protein
MACPAAENDAGTCNAIDATGPTIVSTCLSAEPPQPQGGMIEDGTYVLESIAFYGGCPSTPEATSTTWLLCGTHWDVAQLTPRSPTDPDAGTLPILRLNFEVAVQLTSVSFTLACVPTDTSALDLASRQYTATSTHLTFVYPAPSFAGATEVSVYARQ